MPYVIAGLVAAGGLAAALSTADGLLLAIANALSHDIYYKMIDPNAPTATPSGRLAHPAGLRGRRRGLRRRRPNQPTFCRWWPGRSRWRQPASSRRSSWASGGSGPTRPAAIAGMILGFGICLYYLVGTRYFAVSLPRDVGLARHRDAGGAEGKFADAEAGVGCGTEAAARRRPGRRSTPRPGDRQLVGRAEHLGGAVRPAGRLLAIWIVSLLTPAPSQGGAGHGRRDAPSARRDRSSRTRARWLTEPAFHFADREGRGLALRPFF